MGGEGGGEVEPPTLEEPTTPKDDVKREGGWVGGGGQSFRSP